MGKTPEGLLEQDAYRADPARQIWEAVVPLPTIEQPQGERSPVEQLLDIMENHAADEEVSLAAYRELAESSPDPIVTFLMRQVLEDEDRHHTLLARMAATLRDGLAWRRTSEDLPSSSLVDGGGTDEAIAATQAFIREEHEGVKKLRALARDYRKIHGGLFTVLLEAMALDSEKHEKILRFVLQRLEADKNNA